MKVEIIKSNQKEKWVKVDYKPALLDDCSEIIIDLNKKDQKIWGFGGAFTDAAEVTYHSLSKEKQQEYIKAYFSKEGLNYNLGRYPLMSTDFSPEMYEYLSDENLCNFSLIHDKSRINFVKDALSIKPDIWLISAPWSPSKFMKDNADRCHGGKLLKQYYGLWADTLLTSIKELTKEGIKISALTTQNEPLATQTWESCLYSSEEEADFLMNYLIPKTKENRLDLKFMIYDHNRDKMLERADQMFAFGLKQEDIFGVAYHWYDRNCFEEVKKIHLKYPKQHLLLTECCVELLCDDNNGLGSWENGLRYGINMINDLNNGSEGYIDWNLSLNLKGGPNHVGNFCEAPLMIDAENDEIRYVPSYYVIGHFSKHLNKGDIKVETSSNNNDLLACSFINESTLKVVLLNTSEKNVNTRIKIDADAHIEIVTQGKTLYTLLISL